MHTHMHMHAHTYIYICISKYTYACTHIYTHTDTLTDTQTWVQTHTPYTHKARSTESTLQNYLQALCARQIRNIYTFCLGLGLSHRVSHCINVNIAKSKNLKAKMLLVPSISEGRLLNCTMCEHLWQADTAPAHPRYKCERDASI